jgi:hypothetical protein
MAKSKATVEFGDFQTPFELAKKVSLIVRDTTQEAATVIEPTCGIGTFLKSFTQINSNVNSFVGWEINPYYVQMAKDELNSKENSNVSIIEQDFFQINWESINSEYKEPIVFIGNPPWVTSSELGKLLSKNLPEKSNFQGHSGFDAITGKSNFDISEWMLIKIAEFISNSDSAMAFLVKTSVARKIFIHIANNNLSIEDMFIREIDAKEHFNVSVDACLFYAKGSKQVPTKYLCPVYDDLETMSPYKIMGISNRRLVADINIYKELSDIDTGCEFKWRSGVKHDASKIMEFNETEEGLVNGLGEVVSIPKDFLYPMYKSSNISKEVLLKPKKWMVVTQKKIGDDTNIISSISPKTWEYLTSHANILDARKSSIYKKSSRFAIFGVGDYTFKPWKVVISGLYKNLHFSKINTYEDKPIVLDDTCYMLGFDTKIEADFILNLLKSDLAKSFISSLVFKDNKRPITVALLNRINLHAIACRLKLEEEFIEIFEEVETLNYKKAS